MMKHVAVGLSVLTLAGIGLVTTSEARAQTEERRIEIRTLLGGAGSRIGVSVRDTEANEFDAAGLERGGGVVVETVTDDSPAARSGLQAGDLILEFDGERVRSVNQFRRLVQETPAGRETGMALFRDGSRQSVEITPEATADARAIDLAGIGRTIERSLRLIPRRLAPGPQGRQPRSPFFQPPRLGIVLMPLSEQLRTYFGASEGVLVSEIDAGSPAAEAGLRAGDVITQVDGASVDSSADVVRAVAEAGAGATLEIVVVRDRERLTLRATLPEGPGRQRSRQPV